MSSTDTTTIGVHRALHEAVNSAREAQHRLDDGDATPDADDLVELGKLLAAARVYDDIEPPAGVSLR